MAKLSNDKDLKRSQESLEGGGGKDFVKLHPGSNYIAILSADYEEEFVHFIRSGKKVKKVSCLGGMEGRGFVPDICPICKASLDYYTAGKAAKEAGDTAEAEELKKKGNNIRAQYSAYMQVAVGEALISRDKKTGKKVVTPDFDDFDGEAKVLGLSDARFKALTALIDDTNCPEIDSGTDLVGRVFNFLLEEGNNRVKSVTVVGKLPYKGEITLKDLSKVLANTTPEAVHEAAALLESGVDESDDSVPEDKIQADDVDVDEEDVDDIVDADTLAPKKSTVKPAKSAKKSGKR